MKVEENYRIRPAVLWTALAGYIALIVTVAFYHEVWRDEVRAFSVATDMPSWGSLFSQLRYEGHPLLWYALLRLGFALTHSNLVLPFTAAIVAIGAVYLILRYAPFPLWLRFLAVFGAFLGYEHSVSARNYGIGVLLMIASCLAFRSRRENPVLLGICLFLLANTSIHAVMATLVILIYWAFDLRDRERRAQLASVGSLAALGLITVGVALAIFASKPEPDMAWAVSLSSLDYGKVLRSILNDPGKGLLGYKVTSITAVSEMPWGRVGIDPAIVTRIVVDLCIGWLLWSLRKHPRALVTLIIAILGFEIFFRNIYTASLRHEGIVLFLILAIAWLESDRTGDSKRIALGLLPLFVIQSLALPFLIVRTIRYPESGSKAYGQFIRSSPRYSDAILMSEPDYLMESMPYYVRNPIFMPRQNELTDHVYFGVNGRRRADMTLAELMSLADRVSCSTGKPVLLAIGYPLFQYKSSGVEYPLYRGLTFRWSAADWLRLGALRPVARFPVATSDETYRIYEINPCP